MTSIVCDVAEAPKPLSPSMLTWHHALGTSASSGKPALSLWDAAAKSYPAFYLERTK